MMRVVVLIALLACASSMLSAQALVIHRPAAGAGTCIMPGVNADGSQNYNGGLGDIVQILENANEVTIHCQASGVSNEYGKAKHFSGFECRVIQVDPDTGGYTILPTTDSQATVSASGQATARCTAKK